MYNNLGRRRYLKDINSQNAMVRGGAERNAAPIQGSAADIIKIAMINTSIKKTSYRKLESKMLLQVHELVFDAHNSELDKRSKQPI
jgi:DNA polymerase-1